MKFLQKLPLFISWTVTILLIVIWLLILKIAQPVTAATLLDSLLVGVEIGPDHSSAVDPDQLITYSHFVTNTGSTTDTFNISLLSSAGFTVSVVPESLTLGAGLSDMITVTVVVPTDASGGQTDVTTVTATSTTAPFPMDEALDTTTVNTIRGVQIEPGSSDNANPGQEVVYTHVVTNTGNITDTLNVTYVSSANFPVMVTPSSLDDLPPGTNRLVTVTVTVPSDAVAGLQDMTTVTVTSTFDPNVTASTVNTTTVNLVPGVGINPPALNGSADPGQSITYMHTVKNTGNAPDNFEIDYESSANFTVTLSVNSITLASGASQNLIVTVTVPNNAGNGEVDITTITVASTNHSNVTDTATDTTTVNEVIYSTMLPVVLKPTEWIWKPVGMWPSGETGRSMAVCQSNSNILIAGTLDKLLVYRASTSTWEPVNGISGVVTGLVMEDSCDTVYASVYESGVWRGQRNGSNWNWNQLNSGEAVTLVRSIVLSDGNLFAGGEFGIAHWNGSQWQKAINTPGSVAQPIMHLAVADPINNTGPVYAIQWFNGRVWRKQNPGNTPTTGWAEIPDIDDLPNLEVRAVGGDGDFVRFVGTTSGFYRLDGMQWQLVSGNAAGAARAFTIKDDLIFIGYAGNKGIYVSYDGGMTFTPFNQGFSAIPSTVYQVVINDNILYSATSAGIWRRE